MARLGAVLLPLSVVIFVVATAFMHPHREDPMSHDAVFVEYAQSNAWVAIHFSQWLAAMMLCLGLVATFDSLSRPHGGEADWAAARMGRLVAVATAVAFTILQAVDGIALKWAVDAWVAAPPDGREALFAAAMAIRWTEYALQSYSNVLLGFTLLLLAWPLARGAGYPRWLGWCSAGSGVAWIGHGAAVAYVGLFDSVARLAGILLLVVATFVLSFLMWQRTERVGVVAR
jgi:hypothetical protein